MPVNVGNIVSHFVTADMKLVCVEYSRPRRSARTLDQIDSDSREMSRTPDPEF
jgi:hypothetical protein